MQQLLDSKPLKHFLGTALAFVAFANKDMPRLSSSRVLSLPGLLNLLQYKSTVADNSSTNLMQVSWLGFRLCCSVYLLLFLVHSGRDTP